MGPWWEGGWGTAVSILAIIAAAAVLITAAYYALEWRKAALENRRLREARAHQLAIEEQRTLQMDSAKGSPEMLEIVRSWGRT